MAFTPPPTPPNSGDPANFNPRADAFLGWFPTHVAELNLAGFPDMPVRAQIRGTAAAPVWSFKDDPDTGMWSPGANMLAWSTGGVERLRLNEAGLLTSSTAITQSAIDITPGLLQKVGDYGAGATGGIPAPGGDADQCIVPATSYRFASTGVGLPTAPYAGSLQVYAGTGGYLYQLWFSGSRRLYFRKSTNGAAPFTWHPWQRVVDSEVILGTVGMSGGIPSGAIIERGSFSSGEYTKFADGTLICMGEVSFASVINPSGGGFISSAVFWDFLSPFSSAAAVYAISGHAGLDCKVTAQGGSALGSNIRLEALTSITAPRSARVKAVGRWN